MRLKNVSSPIPRARAVSMSGFVSELYVTMPPTSAGSMPASRSAASTASVANRSSDRPDALEKSVAPMPVISTRPEKAWSVIRRPGTVRLVTGRLGSSGRSWGGRSAVDAQDHAARRHPGAGRDDDVLDVGHLVDPGPADLADGLGDAVHPVQVGLAELAAVGVDRQAATHLDVAVADEVLRLALATEA